MLTSVSQIFFSLFFSWILGCVDIRNWLRNIELHASPDIVKVLVGNKADMETRVWSEHSVFNIKSFDKEYIVKRGNFVGGGWGEKVRKIQCTCDGFGSLLHLVML